MDDLISRQQAIKAFETAAKSGASIEDIKLILVEMPSVQPELKELSEWKADFKGYINALNMPKDDYDGIMEYIDEVPSVQPERKTGRWIPDNTDYYRTKFICSACGESEEVPTTGFGYGTMWDYCPMCGAKMEGGEQE